MKTRTRLVTMIFAPLMVTGAFGADWPQFYGPSRNSTSADKGILRTWPEGGPKVLWTAPLGIGYGGAAVSAGKVYLLDRDDKVGDTLRVYDFANGKELWTLLMPLRAGLSFLIPNHADGGGQSRLYGRPARDCTASTRRRRSRWHKNIWTEFGGGGAVPAGPFAPAPEGGQFLIWGLRQNPLIYRDLLIVASQAPGRAWWRSDKATGDLKWKSEPLAGGAGYDTPSVIKAPSGDQLVMITGPRVLGAAPRVAASTASTP
ncbi:MAG: hypothetical protein IPP47_19755 [Bryobacterales bacterium]|nr:hypothetical protein [Bryobacterales bacterium]